MSDSSSPVCEDCKAGEATPEREAAVSNLGCHRTYELVDACMKMHRGNVADCRREWAAFRACHEARKSAKADDRAEKWR
ncbi:unnamed protein product [Ascophyllum nodosum]